MEAQPKTEQTTTQLSESQREHWERQLEAAEKAVEVAKKVLGLEIEREDV